MRRVACGSALAKPVEVVLPPPVCYVFTMVPDLLNALPPDIRRPCHQLSKRPVSPPHILGQAITEHLAEIEGSPGDLVDRPLAREIAATLQRVIAELWTSLDAPQQRLVQLAADYFVSDDDAEADLESPLGLEDDALVLNLVLAALGRPDLVIET